MTKKKYRYVTGVECTVCNERIWSRHRHDYRHCGCGMTSVDGGREYLRVGFHTSKPHCVRIRVTNEEYAIAERYERGSRWPY